MNTQFKKGILELLVLSLISRRDEYGYSLFRYINNEVKIGEGTLYPLLKKLVKEGNIESYFKESKEGPTRKYYRLTAKGEILLEDLIEGWKNFSCAVNKLIKFSKNCK